ncbi:hypothetical protein DLM78_06560 [Leptospira stimsonii]|uniref:Uncharacterized protein n=1 Tax=Leptospira stimsonii TaxID=2202203 RepID=A0A8B3CV85_9LEPT|nr:hypothetical protein DLM78_06560 [Leptospira stimsonii]
MQKRESFSVFPFFGNSYTAILSKKNPFFAGTPRFSRENHLSRQTLHAKKALKPKRTFNSDFSSKEFLLFSSRTGSVFD